MGDRELSTLGMVLESLSPGKQNSMSDSPKAWDPYQPPPLELAAGPPRLLPTGLKAICIIAIVLGALGTLASFGGLVSLALNQSIIRGFGLPGQSGAGEQAEQLQEELQREVVAIGAKYLPFTAATVILRLVAGLLLLVGGILTLKLASTGRWLLLAGCSVAILYELVGTVLQVVVQTQTLPMVGKSLEAMLQRSGQGQIPPGLGQILLVSMYVMLGVTLVTVLVKIVFYVVSIVYLKKSTVAARFV